MSDGVVKWMEEKTVTHALLKNKEGGHSEKVTTMVYTGNAACNRMQHGCLLEE